MTYIPPKTPLISKPSAMEIKRLYEELWKGLPGDNPVFKTLTVGDGTNQIVIAADGSISLEGDATQYDDLQVSISNVRLPASSAPDVAYYNFGVGGGVTFPALAFAVGEYIYFEVQTSHSMKLESILDLHIHYCLPNTTDIGDRFQFQLDVVAAGVNVQWAVPTGSPFTAEGVVAANDDTYHRLLEIADIPGINTTVSTIYECKLTRIAATADEYAGDVYVEYIDCHYEKDQLGSSTEYTK